MKPLPNGTEADKFLLRVIHDLRAPLRQSRSRAELLQREMTGKLPDTADAHLTEVIAGNRDMDTFLRRLAEYCQAGWTMDRDLRVGAGFVMSNAVQAAGLGSLEPPVRLSSDLNGTVVPAVLQKALVELLDNAHKFHSDAEISIELEAVRSGPDLIFQVSDNGIGFDSDSCERIFEPLERLHGTTAFPGFGFGLAICRRIVLALKGRVWAEPNPAGGATFRLAVPAD